MAEAEPCCFHCGEPIPQNTHLQLELDGKPRSMCCQGCLAVATVISGAGLSNYYRFRQQMANRADESVWDTVAAWHQVDGRESMWGAVDKDDSRDLLLQVSGIRCAACAWLIRSHLEKQAGVLAVQVDTDSSFCRVQWQPSQTHLSSIAGHLFDLGYTPHLPLAQAEEDGRRRERLESLKQLGVAGLGMMQVMMYAVGLYAGEAYGISPAAKGFLVWVSLLVSLPVLLYSGRVFFISAWRGVRNGRPGMDLPASLAIGLAFLASCYQFFIGGGEVWFDSVVMFIFFLSAGRHVELVLRQRNLQAGSALARLLPEWADRLTEQGQLELVPALDLRTGDWVRVMASAAFPADGIIRRGTTEVNESLLTGESIAISKQVGDPVIAGSINLVQSVDVQVSASHDESTLSSLGRLLLSAQARRSEDSGLPRGLVPIFIFTVLLVALGSWCYWQANDPTRALGVALAVLVASCPCALSLALPVVRSAASLSLLRQGILLTRPAALFELLSIDTLVFDKTGTLTMGQPRLQQVELNPLRTDYDRESALQLAAALEAHSNHALAKAFRDIKPLHGIDNIIVHPGSGLESSLDGQRIRLGSRQFAIGHREQSGGTPAAEGIPGGVVEPDQGIWLSDDTGWIARFEWSDSLRPGATQAVTQLMKAGIKLSICSGDSAPAVAACAGKLQITEFKSRHKPEDKIRYINNLIADSRNVCMIGDGINDAPVLAAAKVSIAVHGASELANSAADLILTGVSLEGLDRCFAAARKARKLVRQNLTWALVYNISILPLAISGWLLPWMAALGMSASSLLVILNATRMHASQKTTATNQAVGNPGWVSP